MIFPDRLYDDPAHYLDAYASHIGTALAGVSRPLVLKAASLLDAAMKRGATIFVCGNGGSAAIANHLVCDCVKGVQTGTAMKPKVHSLSSNIEILTAIANDFAYDQVFSYQLGSFARAGDVLIAISSSGNSPNILNALRWAQANGVASVAMTGFEGGAAAGRGGYSAACEGRQLRRHRGCPSVAHACPCPISSPPQFDGPELLGTVKF